jgi:excisionase family DNA binding protein
MRSKKSPPVVAPTIDPNQRWLTVADAAVYARRSSPTIRAMLHRGEVPAARFGAGYLIDRADLDRWLERQKRLVRPYRRGTKPWVADRWARARKKRAAR